MIASSLLLPGSNSILQHLIFGNMYSVWHSLKSKASHFQSLTMTVHVLMRSVMNVCRYKKAIRSLRFICRVRSINTVKLTSSLQFFHSVTITLEFSSLSSGQNSTLTVLWLYVPAIEDGKMNIFSKQFDNSQSWVPSTAQIKKVYLAG